ncbi:hypothetical protein D3C81_2261080 [compost metagenome]
MGLQVEMVVEQGVVELLAARLLGIAHLALAVDGHPLRGCRRVAGEQVLQLDLPAGRRE